MTTEKKATTTVTDVLGHPYGMIRVVGGRATIKAKVFGALDKAVLDFEAFMSDGNHIPVSVRASSLVLVAKESEERVLSAEELKAAQGNPFGLDMSEIAGNQG